MADSTLKNRDTEHSVQEPVLRPGRPADPDLGGSSVPAVKGQAGTPSHSSGQSVVEGGPGAQQGEAGSGNPDSESQTTTETSDSTDSPDASAEQDEVERRYAESYQRRLRRLLRQCERVNLMDFNLLSLSGWPDSYTLSAARRRRDSWLLSATVAALVFLSGLTGMVPAWLAGGGFGAFVVILLLGVPFVRRLYTSNPSYLDLVFYRQQLIRDARRHVAHLEGELGLIWQCNELSEFNPALAAPRFSTLRHLSEQRRLAPSLTRREHFRLYLIFMLEAEKALRAHAGCLF
ncbi:hypothetical protein MLC59_04405 [Marinobacter bryozoorum]|nr:hypothetical protein [Marinobacter bryozoorum]